MGDFLKRHKIIVIFLVIIIPSLLFNFLPLWYTLLFIPILIIDLVYASKKKKQAFQLTHTEQAQRQLFQQQVAKRLEPHQQVAEKSKAQPSASDQEKTIFEKAFEQVYCPKCGAAVSGTVCEECGEKIE